MLSVIMLSVIMLSVIMLSVGILSVVALDKTWAELSTLEVAVCLPRSKPIRSNLKLKTRPQNNFSFSPVRCRTQRITITSSFNEESLSQGMCRPTEQRILDTNV
jgi:hypothetical protein